MAQSSVDNAANDSIFVWLDDGIEKTRESRDTKAQIRHSVRGRLLTFANPDECVDHITTELTTKRIFLIVSNSFGKNLIPLIYELSQIQTVYVYCGNRRAAEEWAKPNLKVSGVFTEKKH